MNEEQNHETQLNTENEGHVELGFSDRKEGVSKNILIISVLAVIIVVLALMYIWGSSIQESQKEVTIEKAEVFDEADKQTETLKVVSSSDELSDIEKDINETELENLDADLEELEAELDAALAQ